MDNNYYDPADLRKFGKISEWAPELGEKFFDYYQCDDTNITFYSFGANRC